MAIISVRVPDDLKRKMEELSWINWSEIIRLAIQSVVNQELGRELAKSVLITESLRRKAPKGWDSVKEIRKWRNGRYTRENLCD